MIGLTNEPVPVPLLVQLPVMSGLAAVPQQTPLALTVTPPSLVTVPPAVAGVEVIAVIDAVVTTGGPSGKVVNCTSLP